MTDIVSVNIYPADLRSAASKIESGALADGAEVWDDQHDMLLGTAERHDVTGELGLMADLERGQYDASAEVCGRVERVIDPKHLRQLADVLDGLDAADKLTLGDDYGICLPDSLPLRANMFDDMHYGWAVDEIGGAYSWRQYDSRLVGQ